MSIKVIPERLKLYQPFQIRKNEDNLKLPKANSIFQLFILISSIIYMNRNICLKCLHAITCVPCHSVNSL